MQKIVGTDSKGFTLIEILVATMIFLMLTALAVVNFQSANRRARDGRRQADLEQARTALEIFRSDIKRYPNTSDGDGGNFNQMTSTLLSGRYLSSIPSDPQPAKYSYYYESSNGMTYSLCAYLETASGNSCPAGVRPCGTQNCNYGVTSP